jgi:mannosyltransferase OCH1-like enzyme
METKIFLLIFLFAVGCFANQEEVSLFLERGAQNLPVETKALFDENYLKKHPSTISKASKPLIPKIIHQIWIGPNPVPEKVKWMMESWKEINPTWEYKLWTNSDLDHFNMVNKKAFDILSNWGAKSDLWRCEILDRFGGVYVDVDFECLKPLDDLHEKYDFYCCILDGAEIANGLIASSPHHPIMKACIERWQEIPFFPTKDPELIIALTGPVFFTNIVAEHLVKETGDLSIVFPQNYFFALPRDFRFDFWNQKMDKSQIAKYLTEDSYAIHYWASTWQENSF